MAAKLSLSRAWEETREVFSRDGRLLVPVALALLALPAAALGVSSPKTPADITPSFYLLFLFVVLFAVAGQIALNRLAVPPDSTVGGAIKRGFERLLPVLIAVIPVFLLIAVVFVVLASALLALGLVNAPIAGAPPPLGLAAVMVLTMLIVFSIFQLVVPISAAEAGGPLQLLSRAWLLSKSNYWRLTAFLAIAWIGMLFFWLIGQLIPGIAIAAVSGPPERGSIGAILVALVGGIVQAAWTTVTSVMVARVYTQLAGRGEAQASVPSSAT